MTTLGDSSYVYLIQRALYRVQGSRPAVVYIDGLGRFSAAYRSDTEPLELVFAEAGFGLGRHIRLACVSGAVATLGRLP